MPGHGWPGEIMRPRHEHGPGHEHERSMLRAPQESSYLQALGVGLRRLPVLCMSNAAGFASSPNSRRSGRIFETAFTDGTRRPCSPCRPRAAGAIHNNPGSCM